MRRVLRTTRRAVPALVAAALACLGLGATEALGIDPPPTPTVSVPTVPSVSVPSLPSVTVPPPVTTPSAPSTPSTPSVPAVGTPSLPVGSEGGTEPGGTAAAITGSTGTSGASGADGATTASGAGYSADGPASASGPTGARAMSGSAASPRVTRVHAGRHWISRSGAHRYRAVTIVFRTKRAGVVVFSVRQLAPTCQFVGYFRVRAHRGVNRVRFRGRVHGTLLAPGTYRLEARAAHRRIARITIVILERPPAGTLRSLLRANACGATSVGGSLARPDFGATAVSRTTTPRGGVQAATHSSPRRAGLGLDGLLLTSNVGEDLAGSGRSVFLVFALVLAALLFAAAALPESIVPHSRAAASLAASRHVLVFAGAAVLAAAVLALILS